MNLNSFRRMFAALCMLVVAGVSVQEAKAQCTSAWLPGEGFPGCVDGGVWASAMWDPDGPGPQLPRLVVGGGFSVIGNKNGDGMGQCDPVTGVWTPVGSGVGVFDWAGFRVRAIGAGPNGQLFIGGTLFVQTGHIARLSGTSWVPMGTGANATVNALAVLPNGDCIAGGEFTNMGGVANTNHIARWNGSTWVAMGTGVNEAVNALLVMPNGDVIAGGRFTNAGGVAASYVARWNGASWSAMGTGMGGVANPAVNALCLASNGDVVAGGEFTTAGGAAAGRVARWNGASWSGVGNIDNTVAAVLGLPNGHIIAAGYFYANVGGLPAAYVAEWNPATPAWSAMGLGLDNYGFTLTRLTNGNVFVGGYFDNAGGNIAEHMAQWNGSSWSAMAPGIEAGAEVAALLTAQSGDLLLGGTFRHAGPLNAGRVASFNGTNWGASGIGMNAPVRAIAQRPNGDFIVGGEFTQADGQNRSRIARWTGFGYVDMNGGIGTFFNPNPVVRALATMANGDVIAGGEFFEAGGGFAYNVARWNGSGWSSLDLGVDAAVRALQVMPGGDLMVGGDFLNVGGALNISAPHIARWNGISWSPVGGGVDGPVHALALKANGDVVVGGAFAAANGNVGYNNIASWNGAVWSPLSSGTDAIVRALTVRLNGDVIAGGEFLTAGGVTVNNIARWSGNGWSSLGQGVQGNTYAVLSLANMPNGDLAIGGQFYVVDGNFNTGQFSAYFARYRFGYPAPIIANQPADAQVCYHGTTQLTATLAPGNYGTVSYQWWRYIPSAPIFVPVPNGTLPSGAIASGAQTLTLTLSNFQAADAGQYYCMITATCGLTPSSVANLTYCGGDFNCDGNVDFFDYLDFVDAYSASLPNSDFNGDGFIDFFDYLDFVDAFSLGC